MRGHDDGIASIRVFCLLFFRRLHNEKNMDYRVAEHIESVGCVCKERYRVKQANKKTTIFNFRIPLRGEYSLAMQ